MKKLFVLAALAAFSVTIRVIRLRKQWQAQWEQIEDSRWPRWADADDDGVDVWVAAALAATWDRP